MFASRANQENAIYEQQTAAAAKPLNQGVKGLAPKTPGNKAPKTPFKVPLNDENTTFGPGKAGGKGKQAALFGEGKSGKVENSAFLTPAGPRNRAPLGNKTTNAKATTFQTPAAPPTQEKLSARQSSPRMRRAKIKVHEAETTTAEDGEEEWEIEYMAPRGVPLPDHPDDCWPIDRTYPQFEGKNLTRGWLSEFAPHKDDDDKELSDLDEKIRKIEELNEKKKRQAQQAKKASTVKPSAMVKTNRDPLTTKPAQGLSSKIAASALSTSTKQHTKTPAPSALASKKGPTSTIAPGNLRHTAAKVASNSTLGYSKGRAVSATARKPLAGTFGKGAPRNENNDPVASASATTRVKTLDELFDLDSLDFGDEPSKKITGAEEDDELECFQLDVAEL